MNGDHPARFSRGTRSVISPQMSMTGPTGCALSMSL
jgi:hypothetical protein